MEKVAPVEKDLARHLLTIETNQSEHVEGEPPVALHVFAKLRLYLSRLVGIAGFQALLVRALALAKAEVGWLESVRVQADATLEGFHETARQQSAESVLEGSLALLAQLLGLLITFIGEAFTLRVIGDVWQEAKGDGE